MFSYLNVVKPNLTKDFSNHKTTVNILNYESLLFHLNLIKEKKVDLSFS